jgi:peptidoglycan/xylan/chitin deacetylase (PgdA/CDA1 family)
VLIFTLIGFGIMALAHTAPARFVLDAMAGDRSVWRMPADGPPTIYLTFDDGPNPTTTPDLLDVLARERGPATFFLIDAHVTEETAPLLRRMFEECEIIRNYTGHRFASLLGQGFGLSDKISLQSKGQFGVHQSLLKI